MTNPNYSKELTNLYLKSIPNIVEAVTINGIKSLIEPITAITSGKDINVFGSNQVSTTLFRDISLMVALFLNYYVGNKNSTTEQPYCKLDFLASGLRILFKFAQIAPAFFSKNFNNDLLPTVARIANFNAEPFPLAVNIVIKGIKDTKTDPLKFVYENADKNWAAEILVGSVVRMSVADYLGETLKYIGINNFVFKPVYDVVDQLILESILTLPANFNSSDDFLTKINKLKEVENISSFQSVTASTSLFLTNIIFGFAKELQGLFIIAPLTRISYKAIEHTRESYDFIKYPAIILASAIFSGKIYEIFQIYNEEDNFHDNLDIVNVNGDELICPNPDY